MSHPGDRTGRRWLLFGLVVLAVAVAHRVNASKSLFGGSLIELVGADGQRIPRLEASGIAYYQGQLVVVDDSLNSLFFFDLLGRLSFRIDPMRFPREAVKFEDLAFDPTSRSFFAVGSHSGRERERFERTSVLLRFRLRRDGHGVGIDEEGVERLPLYRSFERLGLWRPKGMKIEGLAVGPGADHLYVGLREPTDRARVYRLSLKGLEEAAAGGEPPPLEEALNFDAGKVGGTPFCVSALVWVPDRQGLLVATSTEDESTHEFLGNRIWFTTLQGDVGLVRDTFDRGMKAEGLAVGSHHLFISYDNDQDDTDIPSHLRIVPLELLFSGS